MDGRFIIIYKENIMQRMRTLLLSYTGKYSPFSTKILGNHFEYYKGFPIVISPQCKNEKRKQFLRLKSNLP